MLINRSYPVAHKLNTVRFSGKREDEWKARQELQEKFKVKDLFLTSEEMKASETDLQKKQGFAKSMIMHFTDSKIDLGIVILTLVSLLIPPLQLLSMPLFIGRAIVRYVQGRRTPVQNIDAYWDARWANKKPNIYQFSKGKFPKASSGDETSHQDSE